VFGGVPKWTTAPVQWNLAEAGAVPKNRCESASFFGGRYMSVAIDENCWPLTCLGGAGKREERNELLTRGGDLGARKPSSRGTKLPASSAIAATGGGKKAQPTRKHPEPSFCADLCLLPHGPVGAARHRKARPLQETVARPRVWPLAGNTYCGFRRGGGARSTARGTGGSSLPKGPYPSRSAPHLIWNANVEGDPTNCRP